MERAQYQMTILFIIIMHIIVYGDRQASYETYVKKYFYILKELLCQKILSTRFFVLKRLTKKMVQDIASATSDHSLIVFVFFYLKK